MPAFLLFAVTWAGLAPEQALERALDAAEPPAALRAAFHATLTAGNAIRRIEFDPYADPATRFRAPGVDVDPPEPGKPSRRSQALHHGKGLRDVLVACDLASLALAEAGRSALFAHLPGFVDRPVAATHDVPVTR